MKIRVRFREKEIKCISIDCVKKQP